MCLKFEVWENPIIPMKEFGTRLVTECRDG